MSRLDGKLALISSAGGGIGRVQHSRRLTPRAH